MRSCLEKTGRSQPLWWRSTARSIGAICRTFGFLILVVFHVCSKGEDAIPIPFEIRPVAATAESGTEAMSYNSPKGAETIYVRQDVILDLKALKAAKGEFNTSGYCILLELTEEGAKRQSDYCRSRVGERLAILLNGKLVSAPFIGDRIANRTLMFGPHSRAEQNEMLKVFHGLLDKKP